MRIDAREILFCASSRPHRGRGGSQSVLGSPSSAIDQFQTILKAEVPRVQTLGMGFNMLERKWGIMSWIGAKPALRSPEGGIC